MDNAVQFILLAHRRAGRQTTFRGVCSVSYNRFSVWEGVSRTKMVMSPYKTKAISGHPLFSTHHVITLLSVFLIVYVNVPMRPGLQLSKLLSIVSEVCYCANLKGHCNL